MNQQTLLALAAAHKFTNIEALILEIALISKLNRKAKAAEGKHQENVKIEVKKLKDDLHDLGSDMELELRDRILSKRQPYMPTITELRRLSPSDLKIMKKKSEKLVENRLEWGVIGCLVSSGIRTSWSEADYDRLLKILKSKLSL